MPDAESLWTLLMPIRRNFQQYVNLRPVRLFEGVPSPLANPGAIDFMIVRENNEGEYSEIGGRMFPGTDQEMVDPGHGPHPLRLRPRHALRLRAFAHAARRS